MFRLVDVIGQLRQFGVRQRTGGGHVLAGRVDERLEWLTVDVGADGLHSTGRSRLRGERRGQTPPVEIAERASMRDRAVGMLDRTSVVVVLPRREGSAVVQQRLVTAREGDVLTRQSRFVQMPR